MNKNLKESIDRLRNTAIMHSDFLHIPVAVADLQSLLDDAYARGVAAERARVVAWLRAADSETLVWFAAQRIEQGWHDKEGIEK